MTSAQAPQRGLVARTTHAARVFHQLGVLSPSFFVSLVRGGLAAGAGNPAAGVVTGRHYRGDQPAIVDEAGGTTFNELYDRTQRIAQGLRAVGVGPDHNVGILARNHRGFVEATAAASALGADALFLNTGFSGPQLGDVLEREGAKTIIYDDEFEAIVQAGAAHLRRFRAWIDRDGSEVPTLDELVRQNEPGRLPRPARPGRTTILTSGTTGTPKGASRSKLELDLDSMVGLFERLPFRVGETMLLSAPTFHAWGLTNYAIGSSFANTLVMHRRFDPERVLQAIEEHRVNNLVVVPVMLSRILALGAEVIRKYDTSSLRMVGCSGSALPGELALRWMDTFGDNLYNVYGSTEVSLASIAVPEELRSAPGTAGKPPLGATVRIFDPQGNPVPDGTTGRIFVGNSAQFEGYTGGGTKEQIEGLMSIGDVGHFDAEGRLFVEGRDDDMIVSGGENVFPSEVEDLLSDHPAVIEAAVIGVPDEEFGQRLKAFLVLREGASFDESAAKDHVKANLARHKVPRDVVHLDEIPRNPSGKVLKRVLREM